MTLPIGVNKSQVYVLNQSHTPDFIKLFTATCFGSSGLNTDAGKIIYCN
jgi:hypothetical protein